MEEKVICVVNGNFIKDCLIRPGTTALDIIKGLKLPESNWLSTRDGKPFGKDEVVWDKVAEGDKLFSSAAASVAVA